MKPASNLKTDDHRELMTICELAQSVTGIQLGEQKEVMVRARLSKRLRALELSTFGEYLAHLRKDNNGDEMRQMLDLLTTNKTSFLREPRHFEILSKLLEKSAVKRDEFRLWSAGCSSGEEPYTMAMTALEQRASIRILATDLSTRVLAIARAGRYSAETLSPVSDLLRRKYFKKSGDAFEVNEELRAPITFGSLNLLQSWPMRGPFNAIFCRNVMIYFDKPTREKLVERYRQKLVPGGLLFIGLSESFAGMTHSYRLIEPGVYSA
jgi:chemotaxis protein methyltransferase CheR